MARNLAPPRTPASLVPLALLLLIFHGLLGADYVIERFALGDANWPGLMRHLPLDALWLQVVWAMGVWLGVAAAFFLMIRDNASVLLFFATTLAMIAVAAVLYSAQIPALMIPVPALLAILVIVPLFGWIFARALNRNGHLH